MKKITTLIVLIPLVLLFASCGPQKQIARQARNAIFTNPDFAPANIGISIYDPAGKQYLYNYQGDKMFIPASNMKLFTCYAAMKYLGDSLVGLRYQTTSSPDAILIEPTGDPSFLLPEFKHQPVWEFLKKYSHISYFEDSWRVRFAPYGRGWAWDDYADDYAPERSELPIYGNLATFTYRDDSLYVSPRLFSDESFKKKYWRNGNQFKISREPESNSFSRTADRSAKFSSRSIPFKTNPKGKTPTYVQLLEDTLGIDFGHATYTDTRAHLPKVIYSQPTDTLLKIMMHRSDNFFAEQALLMVSNEKLGFMSDGLLIDTLLKTDFAGLPQKPKWVDGSGLSRYNLVTPQDFVWVLTQIKNEFGWKRITAILPTGGEGTLAGNYKNQAGRIYAKTGTVSNQVALSGYIITKKGKQLVFSILVNAHLSSAANIRKGVEKFLTGMMDKY